MSLAEKNAAQAKKIVDSVGPHMEQLAVIADRVNQKDSARLIREQVAALASDTFNLIVLGRFRNGKSTFLNALLCELTHPVPGIDAAGGPMPVDDLPTTAVLTAIDYGPAPAVAVTRTGNRTEHWSLEKYIREARIKRDPTQSAAFFADIEQFGVKFPSKTLQSGITLLDGPGTDDISERTEIVTAASNRCDSAIVLLRSDSLGGQDERRFIQSLYDCELKDLFFVVNRRDGRVVDEPLKQEAWNRVVHLVQGGPAYAGQDLASKKIFFVDAKSAAEARLAGDAAKLAASGMLEFEARLIAFLERDKRAIHLERFVGGVSRHAARVDASIERLIPALKVQADEFRKRYDALQPELKALSDRMNQLPKIVARYRDEAASKLEASFRTAVNDLCRDLPGELATKPIPVIDDANIFMRMVIAVRKQRAHEQTFEAGKAIWQDRLRTWANAPKSHPGAQQVVDRVVQAMIEDVSDQIRDIKARYDKVQHTLTGLAPTGHAGGSGGPGDEWAKRIFATAIAFAYPDIGAGLLNEGGMGLAKSAGVHFGVGVAVLLLGGPVGLAAGAAILAGLIRTAVFAPDRIRTATRAAVVDALLNGIPAHTDRKTGKEHPRQPGLRELADNHGPVLRKGVEEFFGKLQEGMRKAVEQELAAEEASLREQLANASKSADEKQTLLRGFEQFREKIAESRAALEYALTAVQQGRA